jgi:hypothetical protein
VSIARASLSAHRWTQGWPSSLSLSVWSLARGCSQSGQLGDCAQQGGSVGSIALPCSGTNGAGPWLLRPTTSGLIRAADATAGDSILDIFPERLHPPERHASHRDLNSILHFRICCTPTASSPRQAPGFRASRGIGRRDTDPRLSTWPSPYREMWHQPDSPLCLIESPPVCKRSVVIAQDSW